MEQRYVFVRAALREDGDSFRDLCERHGITPKTGYKWLRRFQQDGEKGLQDQSRRPHHHPRQIDAETKNIVLMTREQHPKWGPKKLRAILTKDQPQRVWPAVSTMAQMLKEEGWTSRRRRRRQAQGGGEVSLSQATNQIWSADYKGWFRTRNGERYEPLTIMDSHSRYLLRAQAVKNESYRVARAIFETAFREYGLPEIILTDNGAPFASTGIGGLTRLSVWWLRLGIRSQRIRPGRPTQNGRHERMHGTLQWEAATPPAWDRRQQQRQMERFRAEYNQRRPHEALGMNTPASVYQPSPRPYPRRLPDWEYGPDFQVRLVGDRGEIRWQGSKLFLSHGLVGERVGVRALDHRYAEIRLGSLRLALYRGCDTRILTPQEARRAEAELKGGRL